MIVLCNTFGSIQGQTHLHILYRFKKDWLTHGYASEDKVKQDLEQNKSSEKSAKAIRGVHKRHETLADEPSTLDVDLLKKLYQGNVLDANFAKSSYLCINLYITIDRINYKKYY